MDTSVTVRMTFNDTELYHSFIEPCKREKSLPSYIRKCLYAYYYNDNIRQAIEEFSDRVPDETPPSIKRSFHERLKDIDTSVAMMFMHLEDTGVLLEDSGQFVDKVNKIADLMGGKGITEDDSMPHIDLSKGTVEKRIAELQQTTDLPQVVGVQTENFTGIEDKLDGIMQRLEEYESSTGSVDPSIQVQLDDNRKSMELIVQNTQQMQESLQAQLVASNKQSMDMITQMSQQLQAQLSNVSGKDNSKQDALEHEVAELKSMLTELLQANKEQGVQPQMMGYPQGMPMQGYPPQMMGYPQGMQMQGYPPQMMGYPQGMQVQQQPEPEPEPQPKEVKVTVDGVETVGVAVQQQTEYTGQVLDMFGDMF